MATFPKILFFDSGLGGLSVFKETFALNPQAAYYYLFDHECFPYAKKSESFLNKRVMTLLHGLNELVKPDLIVIACNTASTTVLVQLREVFSIPIVGVVPAIKPAATMSQSHYIALLATPGTVNRAYTDFLINEFAFDCKVLKIGSQELVTLAEDCLLNACVANSSLFGSGWRFCDRDKLTAILDPLLSLPKNQQPDTVVLGCTHFPLLREQIQILLGDQITLVDSGFAIGRRVQSLLQAKRCIMEHAVESDSVTNEGEGVAADSAAAKEQNQSTKLLLSNPQTLGPQMAFFTGQVSNEEYSRFCYTFEHFGFTAVQPVQF